MPYAINTKHDPCQMNTLSCCCFCFTCGYRPIAILHVSIVDSLNVGPIYMVSILSDVIHNNMSITAIQCSSLSLSHSLYQKRILHICLWLYQLEWLAVWGLWIILRTYCYRKRWFFTLDGVTVTHLIYLPPDRMLN